MQGTRDCVCIYQNTTENKWCRGWTKSLLLLLVTALRLTRKVILCSERKDSARRALPHQGPHATCFISSTWKMAAWVRSAPSLLWLSAAFVPSFSSQQVDNSPWALLPRWHFSWQTCRPWLASHLRCLSLVRRSSWFNDALVGLSIHLWVFHPLQRWGGWRVYAKLLTSFHSIQKLYKVRSF